MSNIEATMLGDELVPGMEQATCTACFRRPTSRLSFRGGSRGISSHLYCRCPAERDPSPSPEGSVWRMRDLLGAAQIAS